MGSGIGLGLVWIGAPVVLALLDADVLDVARAWKEEVAELVEGDGHDAVGRVEGLLDAVAVVDVDVP